MKLLAGTSGFAFKEWKGPFYPADLKDDAMLGFYAGRFPTVEINNTFYRLPREHVLLDWASQVPEPFTFAIKASQRITHFARLKPDAASATEFLLKNTSALGARLGPILFQLPPNLKKDAILLDAFLGAFPPRVCAAFEFRHESWLDEEIYDRLRTRNLALCVADSERLSTPVIVTADYAYFRLRDEGYTPDDIARWGDVMREKTSACREVFVYFKHEEEGKGPEFAKLLMQHLGLARTDNR